MKLHEVMVGSATAIIVGFVVAQFVALVPAILSGISVAVAAHSSTEGGARG